MSPADAWADVPVTGITGYATYVPRYRLERDEVAAAVGERARGVRTIAGFDEDSTSMAVEAGRPALLAAAEAVQAVWLATTSPAYVEKTNAATAHAALGLPSSGAAFDLGASARSGAAALIAASRTQGLALLSDIRQGYTGGVDERSGGDAAAAFAFGSENVVAELVAWTSYSAEFLDRWRSSREEASSSWEERFGEGEYRRLGDLAVADLLDRAAVPATDIATVAVSGPNGRAVRSETAALLARTGGQSGATDLLDLIGNAGAAQVGLVLADALDTSRPDELILLVSLADGADAFLFRATERLADRERVPLRESLGAGLTVGYPTYLLWRDRVGRERPRRPTPHRPSAPFAARDAAYKYAFEGARCRRCDTVQFPRARVCFRCHGVDEFDPVSAAGRTARIVTFTVDRLAFSPSPPLISAALDLDVGGRVQCELTDVGPGEIAVGSTVVTTFRRLLTVEGIHNYFWKARPVTSGAALATNAAGEA